MQTYTCVTCGREWPTDYCPECAHTMVAPPDGETSTKETGGKSRNRHRACGTPILAAAALLLLVSALFAWTRRLDAKYTQEVWVSEHQFMLMTAERFAEFLDEAMKPDENGWSMRGQLAPLAELAHRQAEEVTRARTLSYLAFAFWLFACMWVGYTFLLGEAQTFSERRREFTCSECGKSVKISWLDGVAKRCPHCGKTIRVPDADAP